MQRDLVAFCLLPKRWYYPTDGHSLCWIGLVQRSLCILICLLERWHLFNFLSDYQGHWVFPSFYIEVLFEITLKKFKNNKISTKKPNIKSYYSSTVQSCVYCAKSPNIYNCSDFLKLSITERIKQANLKKFCTHYLPKNCYKILYSFKL